MQQFRPIQAPKSLIQRCHQPKSRGHATPLGITQTRRRQRHTELLCRRIRPHETIGIGSAVTHEILARLRARQVDFRLVQRACHDGLGKLGIGRQLKVEFLPCFACPTETDVTVTHLGRLGLRGRGEQAKARHIAIGAAVAVLAQAGDAPEIFAQRQFAGHRLRAFHALVLEHQ